MVDQGKTTSGLKRIRVLVVDDSLSFRQSLRDIIEKTSTIALIGEAAHGIEALELVLRLEPDVIIMDMEMPVMDGMTALQHLMIHKPTPTIMTSSLSREGTARCFDAIKNGAVDFICKNPFLQGTDANSFEKLIIYKILYASKVLVRSIEPVFTSREAETPSPIKPSDIVFCEECGARNSFDDQQKIATTELRCRQCGDLLATNIGNRYLRINYVTVVGAGFGAFANLLRLIPRIPPDISGALIVILYAESSQVDAFTDYLNAISKIRVLRMVDGLNLEGGACYFAAANDYVYMKPYSAHYTIRQTKAIPGYGAVDLIMNSITAVFKNRVAGFILSGTDLDGEKGIKAIKKNGGTSIVLNSANCLGKEMGENILKKCSVDAIVDERDAAAFLTELHHSAGTIPTAA